MSADPIVFRPKPAAEAYFGEDDSPEPAEMPSSAAEPVLPEVVAQATGSAAARMRAKIAQLQDRERRFRVPPEDVWGEDLWLVAKPVTFRPDQTGYQIIAEATKAILWRDDDGVLKPIEQAPDAHGQSGWAGVGRVAGIVTDANERDVSVGDIIKRVTSSDDVAAVLSEDISAWTIGRRSAMERALGE